jgi:pimeloyl-ACP methyl ester carboxylesterase
MKRKFLLSFFILVLLITFVPFFVPVNELQNTVPVENFITEPSQLLVPNSAHLPQEENPEVLVRLIEEFFQ